jgi:DNA modification methylase
MAERNRTLRLTDDDRRRLSSLLAYPPRPAANDPGGDSAAVSRRGSAPEASGLSGARPGTLNSAQLEDRIFNMDGLQLCRLLPDHSVPLIFADPPYPGLRKRFGGRTAAPEVGPEYGSWLEEYLAEFRRILTADGSLYLCGDWRGGAVIQTALQGYFVLRNRITWEREKGRGARSNWKNSHEDIWFCTAGDDYHFDVDAVKTLRAVKAPYRENGEPKDWQDGPGGGWRRTHPGNCWTDLTVPFWSMRENTDHPTQKPEKLLARIILASSREGDLVLDPFLGSGTTAAVASKLGRRFCGADLEREYCLLALRRLELAAEGPHIQGTVPADDGLLFLERNSALTNPGKTLYNTSREVKDD